MSYYLKIINLIIDEFHHENYDRDLINNQFALMVYKFGSALNQNHIKNPYKKAHNQLLKLLQIKINKTNLKIDIHDYISECKSIYVIQYI